MVRSLLPSKLGALLCPVSPAVLMSLLRPMYPWEFPLTGDDRDGMEPAEPRQSGVVLLAAYPQVR